MRQTQTDLNNEASFNREALIKQALDFGELGMFQHRRELQSRRLLNLLNDTELHTLVTDLIEEFRAAFR